MGGTLHWGRKKVILMWSSLRLFHTVKISTYIYSTMFAVHVGAEFTIHFNE